MVAPGHAVGRFCTVYIERNSSMNKALTGVYFLETQLRQHGRRRPFAILFVHRYKQPVGSSGITVADQLVAWPGKKATNSMDKHQCRNNRVSPNAFLQFFVRRLHFITSGASQSAMHGTSNVVIQNVGAILGNASTYSRVASWMQYLDTEMPLVLG
jgi:hypothetical protein